MHPERAKLQHRFHIGPRHTGCYGPVMTIRNASLGGYSWLVMLLAACAGQPEPCAWDVDALLGEAGISAGARTNCGFFWSAESPLPGLACFNAERERSAAVEFTHNACADCRSETTYVSFANGEQFAISREDDSFGDDRRSAKVARCDRIEAAGENQIQCVNAHELHRCTEPRSVKHNEPTLIPVAPRKVQDVPAAGVATTRLHLYVSNQSFERPWVDIGVFINDQRVVIGDFAVEGQHSFHEFDIEVPAGTLSISAFCFRGSEQGATILTQSLTVTTERWAVLNFWTDPEARFTWTVHDQPVAFD
jgi:hypothetical protein